MKKYFLVLLILGFSLPASSFSQSSDSLKFEPDVKVGFAKLYVDNGEVSTGAIAIGGKYNAVEWVSLGVYIDVNLEFIDTTRDLPFKVGFIPLDVQVWDKLSIGYATDLFEEYVGFTPFKRHAVVLAYSLNFWWIT